MPGLSYRIYRHSISGGAYDRIATGIITGSYTDSGVTEEITYYYTIVAVDDSSRLSGHSIEKSGLATAVTSPVDNSIPIKFSLAQNYPNPFNTETQIRYTTPTSGTLVTLRIFNLIGQHVTELVHEKKNAGSYVVQWDGCGEIGEQIPTGIYLSHMKAGSFERTIKLILLR